MLYNRIVSLFEWDIVTISQPSKNGKIRESGKFGTRVRERKLGRAFKGGCSGMEAWASVQGREFGNGSLGREFEGESSGMEAWDESSRAMLGAEGLCESSRKRNSGKKQ